MKSLFTTSWMILPLTIWLTHTIALAQSFRNPAQTPTASKPTSNLTKQQQEKFSRSGIEDITNENFPETIESFDFPNADIADIAKAISELTGRNIIMDPGVRGKVTIIAPSKITVAEAYKLFLSALSIHGYAIVPSDGYYKIRPARAAQRDSIETFSGNYYPNSDQMITKIIHLKYISADEVLKQFRNITTKDGDIAAYAPTNSIIISDYGSNVDRIVKIINQLDVPGFEDQIEVVPVRNAKAKDLADLIEKIVNKGQNPNRSGGGISSGFQGSVPRFSRPGSSGGAGGQQGGAYFMAFPDERTNSLIVLGNKAGIQRVRKLVQQLDIGGNLAAAGGVYVYYVKHGDAEKIAQVINGVAKDAGDSKKGPGGGAPSSFLPPSFLNTAPGDSGSGSGGGAQIFGGEVKVTADKNSNSLVIVASKQDYDKVMRLLGRLDIPQDQVYVEAVITEMSANDSDTWKVGYYQYDESGLAKGGFSTFSPEELQGLTSLSGGSGVIIPFAGKKTVKFKQFAAGGTTTQTEIDVPNILGFINFLKANGKANILSTPRIMGLNNQDAQIKVTQKVPIGLKTVATSTGSTSAPDFEEAGIDLKIKPFISPASDIIRMEITQLVSQPTKADVPAKLAEVSTVIGKREIKTNIVMRSGDTAVLGGLSQDQDKEEESKVPILGDIPVVGWLFKSKNHSKVKTNLMVFLTPKIIRNPSDHQQILGKSLDERTNFIKDSGGLDPYGRKMDEIRQYKADANGNVTPVNKGGDQMSRPRSNEPIELNDQPLSPAEMEDSTVE